MNDGMDARTDSQADSHTGGRAARGSRTGLASFRRYTWWSVPGTAALILLAFVVDWVLDPDVPVWARATGGLGLTMTAVASLVLLSRRLSAGHQGSFFEEARAGWQLPLPWLVAGCVGAATAGAVSLSLRNYGLWAIAPAMMVASISTFLRPRGRWLLIALAMVGAALPGGILSLVSGDPLLSGDGVLYAAAFPVGLVAFIAWTTLGPLWAWDVADRLDHAGRLAAELAVKDERLRFAADLHDIQGHHLQVIALTSELAARLAESDPARAAEHMREAQRLATTALRDTRAVVQGYRRAALDDEIANAAKVLAAADIDTRMEVAPAARTRRLPETSRHLLGLVMREATTNVLRHSNARHADIDYRVGGGWARLRMGNDGVGELPAEGSTGTGLRALTERLAAAGGQLTWEHDGERFEVTAALPVDTERDDEAAVTAGRAG